MADAPFEKSVFINCPFDSEYDAILQAILFCIVHLGLSPRIARERLDSVDLRLEKIKHLIETSKFSIHDLSRCRATKKGEHYRLNMPFELGLDYGCRQYFGQGRDLKRILVLEKEKYRYQAAISDLAGCDIEAHDDNFETAVRKIRNWFVDQLPVRVDPAARILDSYAIFQGWYLDRQLSAGFSSDDISDYSTSELLAAMTEWFALGRPV